MHHKKYATCSKQKQHNEWLQASKSLKRASGSLLAAPLQHVVVVEVVVVVAEALGSRLVL